MELKPLTKKQADVLRFIISEVESGRGIPTYKEVGEEFKLCGPSHAKEIYEALSRKGYVIHMENKARSNILNPEFFKISVSGIEKITLRKPFKRRDR